MAASGQFNLIKQWCEVSIDHNVKRIVQQPKYQTRGRGKWSQIQDLQKIIPT
jgi:hypothetical protein